MERNIFGQHEVNPFIPILKFAENDGSSPYKFATSDELQPIIHDPAIDAAAGVPESPLPAVLPENHPANTIEKLLKDFVPAIDALVGEGARANTTGQWRRDLVLQVSMGLRAVSTVLDDGAPQPGENAHSFYAGCQRVSQLPPPLSLLQALIFSTRATACSCVDS